MCKLTINVGPMFSGKTTALQQQGKKHISAGQNVLFLKPSMDNRYSDSEIVSHDGERVNAVNITDSVLIDLAFQSDVILIDEVQFLPISIIDEIWTLLEKGKIVYCSGLDMNYLAEGFDTTMHLMAMADKINKFASICHCGKEATMSSKRVDNGIEIELGSSESYYPTCRKCYLEERKGDKC